ncbi:hypothetical protein Tco_0436170 [Tanacetum coccineum]
MKSRWRFLFLNEGHLDFIFSDIKGASTSRNVRSRLVPGHSAIFRNATVFSGTAEWRLGTANTIYGRGTIDINCVPIHVKGSGASRNVRRRLLAGHSSMLGNANVFSGAVELRPGTANTIRGRDTADINCVPIRNVFDRFRNMRTPYIEADCMTQPAIRKRSLSAMAEPYPTVYRRGAPAEISRLFLLLVLPEVTPYLMELLCPLHRFSTNSGT